MKFYNSYLTVVVALNIFSFAIPMLAMQPDQTLTAFSAAIGDLKIFSLIISHIREDDEIHTAYRFQALNRVNKQFNALLSTPSILHQMVYQLAAQSKYRDELYFANRMKNMKAYVHPAFEKWLATRKKKIKIEKILFFAAQNDDSQTIKELIEKEKVNINARNGDGKTALSIAASFGANKALIQLLSYGPDINLPNKYGWTPLKKASNEGTVHHERRVDSVKLLLEAGAAIDQEDDEGYTPIMIACPEIAKILISHRANVNHQASRDGTTSLMWAVINNKIQTVTMLIDAGAHDKFRNNRGYNAREIARNFGSHRFAILRLLEQKFGKD
jgi:hypothetical protein